MDATQMDMLLRFNMPLFHVYKSHKDAGKSSQITQYVDKLFSGFEQGQISQRQLYQMIQNPQVESEEYSKIAYVYNELVVVANMLDEIGVVKIAGGIDNVMKMIFGDNI